MRITSGLTFGEAKGLAAAYFGLYEDDFGLVVRAGALASRLPSPPPTRQRCRPPRTTLASSGRSRA